MDTPGSIPLLPVRSSDSHKGTYGRGLLVGGSMGMSGAIGLSGMAALRSGAGLVTLAVPEVILATVAGYEPSYMTIPLPCDADGRLQVAAKDRIRELADQANCIAVGPGIGRSSQVTELVVWMYSVLPKPLVLDADALFALAQKPECLHEPAGPRVLTPHPGEFRRLMRGESFENRLAEERAASDFAGLHKLVMVLKGHGSLISDGRIAVHNETGNPGMATGGTGDVLTGVITALICQGLTPLDAAVLGTHVHGAAGDLAAAAKGQVGMIARDVVEFLPAAFQQVGGAP